jgi:hypothetical protein
VVIDALDDISVQLELGDDGGREVNPGGVQLGKSDRLLPGLAQSLQHPLLLGVKENHRPLYTERPAGEKAMTLISSAFDPRVPRGAPAVEPT